MKRSSKLLALLLAVVMCVGMLAACGNKTGDNGNTGNNSSNTQTPSDNSNDKQDQPDTPAGPVNDTLVASVEKGLEGKFSPFFYLSANDATVVESFTLYTMVTDRVANPILKGIEGETRPYNGTDYTYYTPSDITVTENEDGTVYYDMTIRDDIVFSDGTPATIDDVIFGLYVYLDPTYDGNGTLYSLPIEGLDAYRSGMSVLYELIFAAGPDNTDFSLWSEEIQNKFWNEGLNAAGEKFVESIINYVVAQGYAAETDDLSVKAAQWGFTVAEGGSMADLWQSVVAQYDGDYATISDVEAADRSLWSCLDPEYTVGVQTGESAPNITGIQKTGDYSLRIVATELDATMIYQMSLPIAPLHHYGDKSLYDYDKNMFGFTKGDLSIVKAKTTDPLGAGPFIYSDFSNGVVYMDSNPSYYRGEPKIPHLNYLESTEDDKINGIVSGTLDVADPSYTVDRAKEIAAANGFAGEDWEKFDGPVLTTKLIDYRGYGYVAISPTRVSVNGEKDSEASKNLRKAFATLISVYRDESVDSYYGTTASIINYPISNTSWAAPQTTDDGYQVAYSVDVNGEPIYTADMTAEQKYEAAKKAALGYFEAAGCTVEDGKITAFPEGVKSDYTVHIGGNGKGDHPSFLLLNNVSAVLKEMGVNFQVKDYAASSELYASYQTYQADFWVAAWQSSSDPDMFQLYHSDGSTNYYQITDPDLDEIIETARASTDQPYRKALYQSAMEIIMDWAVEVPIYQRSDCMLFSSERVNISTIPTDMTPYWGWAAEIETLELN